MEQYRIRLLLNTLMHAQSAMASLVLSGPSAISRSLKSVVDFRCPSVSLSSLCHRRPLFSWKVSPAAQDSTVPCFPSAGLVSASLTAPRGAAGLTSLLSSLEMLSPLAYYYFFPCFEYHLWLSDLYFSLRPLLQIADSCNKQRLYFST